jgi:hypothetical protein
MQCNRINLVIIARKAPELLDLTSYRIVISMVVLRAQPETGNSTIGELRTKFVVHEEICDAKVAALDPELLRLGNGIVDNHARVSDDNGKIPVLFLGDGARSCFVLSNKKVFEALVLGDVRWFDLKWPAKQSLRTVSI